MGLPRYLNRSIHPQVNDVNGATVTIISLFWKFPRVALFLFDQSPTTNSCYPSKDIQRLFGEQYFFQCVSFTPGRFFDTFIWSSSPRISSW